MKATTLLALLVLGARAAEPGATSWATVPASPESGRLEVFPVAGAMGDNVISLVGGAGPKEPVAPPHVQVMALEWAPDRHEPALENSENESSLLPSGVIWPGPDGRISLSSEIERHNGATPGLRNPWEIRIHPRKELDESVFTNGGLISGGADPVAFLNGHIARKGKNVDGFEVALVTNSEVVVTKGGLSYVVPLGRRVTIETSQR
jgi:hypothetical protein